MNHRNSFFQTEESKTQHTNRILIIENSESLGTLYKSILLQREYTIFTASCGHEAISMLETFRPNLIIAPAQLPDMDSAELRDHVAAQSNELYIPILVLSTQKKSMLYSRTPSFDKDETLFLPFRIKDLRGAVEKLLGTKHSNAENFYYPGHPQKSHKSEASAIAATA